jgi:predicted RNA binding protein YcfA (HicA-like mRNA interferase family)
MRAYKVIEVIKLLEADGWILVATKGDHRQYKHPQKKGKVTIRVTMFAVANGYVRLLNSLSGAASPLPLGNPSVCFS